MGFAKNEQIKRQEKLLQTISLCIGVGAITECEIHNGEFSDTYEFLDPEELVEELLELHPDAIEGFDSRSDMIDCVSEALASAGDECGICANNRAS